MIGQIMTIAIGAMMLAIMAIAGFHEIAANDFFGASISLLIVTFGFQLMLIGIRDFSGKARDAGSTGPLEELWRSDNRIYPFRPYSSLEIRGR
ncbi:MAG: hypothetical protein ACR2Q4_06900 [Geminicoccaceae bacterium]